MARIRTIKPEFWEDAIIGGLSREARLLFLAALNLADDEGILRWSEPFLKAGAFIYDADMTMDKVQSCMEELESSGLVFSYKTTRALQPFALIVGFHKHQKINRPTPSRLSPPGLHYPLVIEMYAKRDGWKCHLCLGEIENHLSKGNYEDDFLASVDHVIPKSKGGSDFPSNIRAAHRTCNKSRGNRSIEDFKKLLITGKTMAARVYPERYVPCGTTSEPSMSPHENIPQEVEVEVERDMELEVDAEMKAGFVDEWFEQVAKAHPRAERGPAAQNQFLEAVKWKMERQGWTPQEAARWLVRRANDYQRQTTYWTGMERWLRNKVFEQDWETKSDSGNPQFNRIDAERKKAIAAIRAEGVGS